MRNTTKLKIQAAALAVAGSLAGACGQAVEAQENPPAPTPAPQTPPDEATKPVQRPIDDGAVRALAAEVARLQAEIAAMRKDAAAKQGTLIEPVDATTQDQTPAGEANVSPLVGSAPADGGETTLTSASDEPVRVVERETTYVEREVPVYVDREVPVYVDQTVYVEREPTIVLERVVYRDSSCDQWIPRGHIHSIGCGHHYYGCACHSWYYDLLPTFSLSFSFVHDDHHHHDRDRGHGHDRDHRSGGNSSGGRGGDGRGDRDSHHGQRDDDRGRGGDRDGRQDRSARREQAPGAPVAIGPRETPGTDAAPAPVRRAPDRSNDASDARGREPVGSRGDGSSPRVPVGRRPQDDNGRASRRADDRDDRPRAGGERRPPVVERAPGPVTPRADVTPPASEPARQRRPDVDRTPGDDRRTRERRNDGGQEVRPPRAQRPENRPEPRPERRPEPSVRRDRNPEPPPPPPPQHRKKK